MATKLLRDITRETLAVIDTKGRVQIVTLKAGDMLEFRAKGKRFKYAVPLAACYNMALIYTAHEWQRARIARYNERRKNGERVKRRGRLHVFSIQSFTKPWQHALSYRNERRP